MGRRSEIPSFSSVFLLFLSLSYAFRWTHQQQQQPIKTIVILVLENRSFDHMLGWMKNSINPSINGVTGKECNPVSTQTQHPETICFTDDAEFVDPDPGHSFEAVEQQVFGSGSIPSMNGFVEQALSMSQNLSETVMKGFKPENVPVYATLVREFAVFDRWFSSIPGPTQPNRLFVYSATSHGSTSHVKKQLAKGYPQKTIFDSVHESRLDFGIYFQNIPSTLFYRNLRKLKYIFKFHQYDLKFKKDARKGKLPSLTIIEPRYFDLKGFPGNDDHPSHDVANGQRLVKEVYETLRASPQWNETLLVITYDEHGGFYDHVQTPYVNVPNPDGNTGPAPGFFKFDRLGVRVPTIMVSPWIKKGTVISKPNGPTPNSEFEHSSIPATIKKMFNLSSNFLTHRDAWAGTFELLVGELTSPRTDCPVVLPDVASLRKTEADESRGLSEFQSEVVQLAAVLNGDHFLSSFPDEMGKKMSVKEAHEYTKGAVSRFIRASKEAIMLGADESAIVDMRKIRPCPSINPGCVSTNPQSSAFAFPWTIPEKSLDDAVQQLQNAILSTQKNVQIQVVDDTPYGKYLQAEVDGGFGRDVLEFLVKGDMVAYRAMATKVTYVYPFTTAFGDSKGQEERMKKIMDQLGWYAPSLDFDE